MTDPQHQPLTPAEEAEMQRARRELGEHTLWPDDAIGRLLAIIAAVCAQNAALREIISRCATAIGNGSFASSEASLEFLGHIPMEIASVLAAERARAEKAEGERDAEMVLRVKAELERDAALETNEAVKNVHLPKLVSIGRERDTMRAAEADAFTRET